MPPGDHPGYRLLARGWHGDRLHDGQATATLHTGYASAVAEQADVHADQGRVRQLLPRLPHDPNRPLPSGASDQELTDLATRLGTDLPEELAAWLRMCNGDTTGPGGLFGARPDTGFLDIAWHAATYPGWLHLGWLPVAGDGCGNSYVLLTRGPLAGCVAFVDAISDPDEITYVAASNLWRFLRFLFEKELGAKGWPFASQVVLAADPDLAQVPGDLLPWTH